MASASHGEDPCAADPSYSGLPSECQPCSEHLDSVELLKAFVRGCIQQCERDVSACEWPGVSAVEVLTTNRNQTTGEVYEATLLDEL
eukprot:747062-Hanusia_phi.AAC.3